MGNIKILYFFLKKLGIAGKNDQLACKIVEASSQVLAKAIDQVFRLIETDGAEVTISKGRIDAFRDACIP